MYCKHHDICGYWYNADLYEFFNEEKSLAEVITPENIAFARKCIENMIGGPQTEDIGHKRSDKVPGVLELIWMKLTQKQHKS